MRAERQETTGGPAAPGGRVEVDWIQTYSHRQFRPLDPDPAAIDVADIAHSLALQCRFNGHCRTFYSVADHSIRVSRAVPPDHALWGLLHDATEAYLSDMPRPIKVQMPIYRAAEDRLMQVIAARFGLPWPMPAPVHHADNVLLVTEQRDLMGPPPASWGLVAEPLAERIVPLSPQESERAFLARFDELTRR